MEELINAVDKVTAQRQAGTRRSELAFERLYYMFNDTDESFLRTVSAARIKRAVRFNSTSMDAPMQDLVQKFFDIKDTIVDELLKEGKEIPNEEKLFVDTFKKISEETPLGLRSSRSAEQEYIASVLGEKEKGLEGLFSEELSRIKRKASIVRAEIGERSISPEVLGSLGGAPVSPSISDEFSEGLDAAIKGEDYSSFIKTKFTRFSDYIKSGRLKELFNKNELFRNSVYATTALIAASFAYQAHKDHKIGRASCRERV